MNFCPNCGSSIVDNSKFCSNCGAKLDSTEAGDTGSSAVPASKIHKRNKGLFISIGLLVLVLLIAVLPSFKSGKRGPEKVVHNFIKSFYGCDPNLALDSLASNVLMEMELEMRDYYPEYTKKQIIEEIKHEIKDEMDYINSEIVEEIGMGMNWIDLIELETIVKSKDTSVVRVHYYQEFADVHLVKEKGKWKITDIPDMW